MLAFPHSSAHLALGALEMVSSTRLNPARLVRVATAPDCGPAALATLLHFYLGVSTTEAEIAAHAGAKPESETSMRGLEAAARAKGCNAGSLRVSYNTLQHQLETSMSPVIVQLVWPSVHFALVFAAGEDVALADPCVGHFWLSRRAFTTRWLRDETQCGFAFLAARADGFADEANLQATHRELGRARRALQVASGLI